MSARNIAWLKVRQVSPGVLSTERVVKISTLRGVKTFVVHPSAVRKSTTGATYVKVARVGGRVLVRGESPGYVDVPQSALEESVV